MFPELQDRRTVAEGPLLYGEVATAAGASVRRVWPPALVPASLLALKVVARLGGWRDVVTLLCYQRVSDADQRAALLARARGRGGGGWRAMRGRLLHVRTRRLIRWTGRRGRFEFN